MKDINKGFFLTENIIESEEKVVNIPFPKEKFEKNLVCRNTSPLKKTPLFSLKKNVSEWFKPGFSCF